MNYKKNGYLHMVITLTAFTFLTGASEKNYLASIMKNSGLDIDASVNKSKLARGIYGLELGMTIEEVNRIVGATADNQYSPDNEDTFAQDIKYTLSSANSWTRANEMDESFYEMKCQFFKNKLYYFHIIQKMNINSSFEEFIQPYVERLGKNYQRRTSKSDITVEWVNSDTDIRIDQSYAKELDQSSVFRTVSIMDKKIFFGEMTKWFNSKGPAGRNTIFVFAEIKSNSP